MATTSKTMKISSYATGGKHSGKSAQVNSSNINQDDSGAAGSGGVAAGTAGSSTGGIITIPIIKSKDIAKQLPTYAAALTRSSDDHLAAEDLDNIQLELESLLSNVAVRYRIIKSEYENLDKDDKVKDKKSKNSLLGSGFSSDRQPTSPAAATSMNGKRKREDSSGIRKVKHSNSKHKNAHSKNSPIAQHTDDSMDYSQSGSHTVHTGGRDQLQKLALPKNDIPNKFWLSVEPYCMPLTNEDLRLLDDLLEQYNGPIVPPIPDLGPHYSTVWAAEDLKEVQQSSNPNANQRLKTQSDNNAAADMLKRGETLMGNCVTGPLTQRLVSALIEEKLLTNPSEIVADNSNSSSENTQSSIPMNFRSLSMLRNCIGIENRVKNELIEQGILDISDFPNNDEDQVLNEIKKLIAELSSIADYNNKALRRLREAAAGEIKRLEVKRKLDLVDQEIVEIYKRIMQNKPKRKPLTIEDQQEIYRLTSEQKALSDQLESLRDNTTEYD